MKKIILLAVIQLFLAKVSISQTPDENWNKYWNYKQRLLEKFMVSMPYVFPPIGYGYEGSHVMGTNLIANTYNPNDDGSRYPLKLAFGDQTIDLGIYLGVLATEYDLLKKMNYSLNDVEAEIIRALRTIIRLDINAEFLYGCGNQSNYWEQVNGFFIRDDVYDGFTQYWYDRGYDAFDPNILREGIKSDYAHRDGIYKAEMSQDQVWGLFAGLALVKKLVDSENLYYAFPNVPTATIELITKEITNRLILAMQYNGIWKIVNPCSGEIVTRGGSFVDLLEFAFFFRYAAEWITDGLYGSYHINRWDIFPYGAIPFPFTLDNYYKVYGKLTLDCIGGQILGGDSPITSIIIDILLYSTEYNNIPYYMNDQRLFCYDHLPLFHMILHNSQESSYLIDYYFSYIENLLKIAPPEGPSFYGNLQNIEWIDERLRKPVGVAIDEFLNEGQEYFGEKPGIDFMLLHNLYTLAHQTQYNEDRIIVDDFPSEYSMEFSSGSQIYLNIGDITNETFFTINSMGDIHMNSMVNSNGKVKLRAGGTIILEPGFKVEEGGIFIAEHNPYKDFFDNSGKKSISSLPELRLNKNILNREQETEPIIYPNPTSDLLHIKVNISNEAIFEIPVEVYNLRGELLISDIINNMATLNVETLDQGFYIIKLKVGNMIYSNKLIIND